MWDILFSIADSFTPTLFDNAAILANLVISELSLSCSVGQIPLPGSLKVSLMLLKRDHFPNYLFKRLYILLLDEIITYRDIQEYDHAEEFLAMVGECLMIISKHEVNISANANIISQICDPSVFSQAHHHLLKKAILHISLSHVNAGVPVATLVDLFSSINLDHTLLKWISDRDFPIVLLDSIWNELRSSLNAARPRILEVSFERLLKLAIKVETRTGLVDSFLRDCLSLDPPSNFIAQVIVRTAKGAITNDLELFKELQEMRASKQNHAHSLDALSSFDSQVTASPAEFIRKLLLLDDSLHIFQIFEDVPFAVKDFWYDNCEVDLHRLAYTSIT